METIYALATPEFTFKDGSARNTGRIPKAEWDEHKKLLRSLYQEKTIAWILVFMRIEHGFVANAGQLGRKMREWGVYKYDSKNRPEDRVQVSIEGDDIPDLAPITSSSEITQQVPIHDVLADDIVVDVPPTAHIRHVSKRGSDLVQSDQVTAKTPTEYGFHWHVEKVLEEYSAAISLVTCIQRKDADTPSKWPVDRSLIELKSSLQWGQTQIERLSNNHKFHIECAYGPGDLQALDQMKDISITLQSTVLSNLQRRLSDNVSIDYAALRPISGYSGVKAAACLHDLCRRLFIARSAWKAPIPKDNMLRPPQSDRKPATLAPQEDFHELVSETPADSGQSSSGKDTQALDEKTAHIVRAIRVATSEPRNARLSDIDMDRFSAISVTSSARSMKSLAIRIKAQQTARRHLDRTSTDDVPSSVMQWDRSSDPSLRLFGQLSSKSSDGSSVVTDASDKSWRPEIPATIQEDVEANSESSLPETSQERFRLLSSFFPLDDQDSDIDQGYRIPLFRTENFLLGMRDHISPDTTVSDLDEHLPSVILEGTNRSSVYRPPPQLELHSNYVRHEDLGYPTHMPFPAVDHIRTAAMLRFDRARRRRPGKAADSSTDAIVLD